MTADADPARSHLDEIERLLTREADQLVILARCKPRRSLLRAHQRRRRARRTAAASALLLVVAALGAALSTADHFPRELVAVEGAPSPAVDTATPLPDVTPQHAVAQIDRDRSGVFAAELQQGYFLITWKDEEGAVLASGIYIPEHVERVLLSELGPAEREAARRILGLPEGERIGHML